MLDGDFHPTLPRRREVPDEVDTLCGVLEQLGTQVEASLHGLEKLAALTEQINAGYVVEDILQHVFESFSAVIPYDRIGCALLEEDGSVVRAFWEQSTLPTRELSVGYAAPMCGSSLQTIIDTGRPRIINDLEQYLADHPHSKSTRRVLTEGIRSSLTCPLVAMSKPIGFLFFSSTTTNTYANAHVDFFMRVAGQLSTILEKGRMYSELLEAKQQVEQANVQLARLASVDGLTGVANRRAFDERFDAEWRRARDGASALSVLLIDIDHFKRVNDTYGHAAGDECLKALGRALGRASQRAGDFVARYGGEEFTVVLPETGQGGAITIAEKIRAEVEALEVSIGGGAVVRMTISVGIATMVHHGAPAELLVAADRALYAAKEHGRNCIVSAPVAVEELEVRGERRLIQRNRAVRRSFW
jgi:diguanylate cyclase (GGDEF)-like protein